MFSVMQVKENSGIEKIQLDILLPIQDASTVQKNPETDLQSPKNTPFVKAKEAVFPHISIFVAARKSPVLKTDRMSALYCPPSCTLSLSTQEPQHLISYLHP